MKEFTILISDRNKNVREYLRREMESEGYHVRLARSAREVLSTVFKTESVDLVILDPELFEGDELGFLERIGDRIPALPVVIHSFFSDYPDHSNALNGVYFVEKNGNSIEHLKKLVSTLLH